MDLQTARFDVGLWLRWVVVCTAGFALVGLLFHFPGAFPPDPGGVGSAIFGFAGPGALSGLLVGVLQWLVLRHRIAHAPRWIPATALGLAVTHGLADGLPALTVTPVYGLLAGGIVGSLQWLFLRPALPPIPWTGATMAGWTLGMILGLSLAHATGLMAVENPAAWAQRKALIGAVLGLLTGAVSGLVLVRRLRGAARHH